MSSEADHILSSNAHGNYEAMPSEGAAPRFRHMKSLTGRFVSYSKTGSALRLCGSLILAYLVIGVLCYTYLFEHEWTVIDSLYFSVVTFTTVGYGDLTPSTGGGQIFTIFFVLFGIGIIGVALGVLGDSIIEAEDTALETVKSEAKSRVMRMFSAGEDTGDRKLVRNAATFSDDLKDFFLFETPIFIVIIALAILIGWYEEWTYLESIYYCFITTTTVGYGDISPGTQAMRLYAVFFLPLSVIVVCNLIGRIAGYYMDRKAAQSEKNFMERELTLKDIEVMDADSDGSVSMMEFVSFMLVAMQKVDKGSIEELKTLFKSLDVDGSGHLQKRDLQLAMAQRAQDAKNAPTT